MHCISRYLYFSVLSFSPQDEQLTTYDTSLTKFWQNPKGALTHVCAHKTRIPTYIIHSFSTLAVSVLRNSIVPNFRSYYITALCYTITMYPFPINMCTCICMQRCRYIYLKFLVYITACANFNRKFADSHEQGYKLCHCIAKWSATSTYCSKYGKKLVEVHAAIYATLKTITHKKPCRQ